MATRRMVVKWSNARISHPVHCKLYQNFMTIFQLQFLLILQTAYFNYIVYISYNQLSVIKIYSVRANFVPLHNRRSDQIKVLAVHVAAEVEPYVLSFDLKHESVLH